MRLKRDIVIASVVAALALGACLYKPLSSLWRSFARAGYSFDSLVFGRDAEVLRRMDMLKVGMSEREVVALMGAPREVDTRPYIVVPWGHKTEPEKHIPNPNKCYWYSTGVDVEACVVFGKDSRVAYVRVDGS